MSKILPVVAVALLAGCASQGQQPVGMANPASVYCKEIGGSLQIENTSAGQVGICVLPTGERIEEWELYRREHPESKV
ncbi:DUF333 domain-containing protein [Bordetella petrii]|nr:DUF333 domain-containing protein [Bordetella petrii]